MKTCTCLLALALLLACAAGAAAEDKTAPQEDVPPVGLQSVGYLSVGAVGMLLDEHQFNATLNALGLKALPAPVGADLAIGFYAGAGVHNLDISFWIDVARLETHGRGNYASLTDYYYGLRFAYRAVPTPWLSVYAGVGPSLGGWQYVVLAGSVDGQARGDRWALDPRGGVSFRVAKWLSIDLFGGYQLGIGNSDQLFSGGMNRGNEGHLVLDHAVAGLDLMFLTQK